MYMHFWYAMHWHLWCAESLVRCSFGELYLGCNISLVYCILGVMHFWYAMHRHLWWWLIGARLLLCIFGALFLGLGCNIFLVLRLWCYALSAISRRLVTAVAHLLYYIDVYKLFIFTKYISKARLTKVCVKVFPKFYYFYLVRKPFPSFIGKLLKCLSCQNAFRPFSEDNKLSPDTG